MNYIQRVNDRQFYCFGFIFGSQMSHIGLQTRENVFNKTRRVQFQIHRFKAYQHLQTTINKSNGIFVIEILEI